MYGRVGAGAWFTTSVGGSVGLLLPGRNEAPLRWDAFFSFTQDAGRTCSTRSGKQPGQL